MTKNSMSFFASMLLAVVLLTGGCNLDPLTERGYSAPKSTVDAGHHHGGYDAGGSGGVDTYTCVPQCGNKVCGSNGCGGTCGTCGSNETCSAGACVAMGGSSGTHACPGKCDFGSALCFPYSGIVITCVDFQANVCDAQDKCVPNGAPFNVTCDDGNAATADSVKSIGDEEWATKSELCIHTPIGGGGQQTGCTAGSCGTGQVCNSTTGQCFVPTTSAHTCKVRPKVSSSPWLGLQGGGVPSLSVQDVKSGPWQNTQIPPAADGWASVEIDSQKYACFLPKISNKPQWAFGVVDGYAQPQNVGDWEAVCDSLPVVTFTNSTPFCKDVSLQVGGNCRWYNLPWDYRFCVRVF